MRNNTTGLLFLIGAGAGAVATYLLDPERGEARRSALSASANDALDRAGNAVGQTVSHLTDTTRHASERASALASEARATGNDWLHRGSAQVERSKSLLGHWFEKEKPTTFERASTLAQSIGSHLDRKHLATPVVLGSGTGTLLAGLSLYYFFGCAKAAEHRNALAKKVHLAARETGELGRKTGAYLRDRLNGSAGQDVTSDERGDVASVGEAPESGEPSTVSYTPRSVN